MSPTLSEMLRAIFELGLPVAVLSWLLFYRYYSHRPELRELDRVAVREHVKTMREDEKASDEKPDSLLRTKWMKFGGGFYGVAAAWTLIYIELSGLIGNILHPSALLDLFHKGIEQLISEKISGQVTTLVDAATWFSWWPGRGHHQPAIWFAVAYLAYLAGLELARHESGIGTRVAAFDSPAWWRERIPFLKRRVKPEDVPGDRVDH